MSTDEWDRHGGEKRELLSNPKVIKAMRPCQKRWFMWIPSAQSPKPGNKGEVGLRLFYLKVIVIL